MSKFFTKILRSWNKRFNHKNYQSKTKQLKDVAAIVDQNEAKKTLAENNLEEMRGKYKALAAQYLADQERWNSIENRLKKLTKQATSSRTK